MTDTSDSDLSGKYTLWLQSGFETLSRTGNVTRAFPDLIVYLHNNGDLALALSEYREQLKQSANELRAFDQAIDRCLALATHLNNSIDVIQLLLRIIDGSRIYLANNFMSDKIFKGISSMHPDDAARTIAIAMQAIMSTATPGDAHVTSNVARILEIPGAEDTYCGLGLIAMCISDPVSLKAHLAIPKLSNSIEIQLRENDIDGAVSAKLARELYKAVGFNRITELVMDIGELVPHGMVRLSEHSWLGDVMWADQNRPMNVIVQGSTLTIESNIDSTLRRSFNIKLLTNDSANVSLRLRLGELTDPNHVPKNTSNFEWRPDIPWLEVMRKQLPQAEPV